MEVIAPPSAAAPRIAATEDVGALPLFHLYAEHVAMSPPAVTAGCDILQVCIGVPHTLIPADLFKLPSTLNAVQRDVEGFEFLTVLEVNCIYTARCLCRV